MPNIKVLIHHLKKKIINHQRMIYGTSYLLDRWILRCCKTGCQCHKKHILCQHMLVNFHIDVNSHIENQMQVLEWKPLHVLTLLKIYARIKYRTNPQKWKRPLCHKDIAEANYLVITLISISSALYNFMYRHRMSTFMKIIQLK